MTRLFLSLTALIIVGIAVASVSNAIVSSPVATQSEPLQIQSKSAEFAGLNLEGIESSDLELVLEGEGLVFRKLAVYPIVSSSAQELDNNFKSLEKAMDDKELDVREINGDGSSAQVNTLEVINNGTDSVYLLAGDLVKGGKQDRVLAEDVVIPPGGGPVKIDAFCVEQGRWTVEDDASFEKTEGVVGNKIRKAVMEEKNQGRVWEEVAKNNKAADVSTSTGTYNAWVQNEGLAADLERYKKHFIEILDRYPDAVGFVVASGDEVTGGEFFVSADMFRERRESLLQGYTVDALANGDQISVSKETVVARFEEMLSEYNAIPDSEEGTKWHYAKMY